jgi:hypothetical protein
LNLRGENPVDTNHPSDSVSGQRQPENLETESMLARGLDQVTVRYHFERFDEVNQRRSVIESLRSRQFSFEGGHPRGTLSTSALAAEVLGASRFVFPFSRLDGARAHPNANYSRK